MCFCTIFDFFDTYFKSEWVCYEEYWTERQLNETDKCEIISVWNPLRVIFDLKHVFKKGCIGGFTAIYLQTNPSPLKMA